MSRVYNFAAGPAVLPEEVLKEAADEMLDYNGTGMSVMEMSHRSKDFEVIIQDAERNLRELMNIPNNYKVLFLQGGASMQFAMVPMNLMKNRVADYIITGQWAKKAATEAEKFGKVNVLATSADKTFSYIPDMSKIKVSNDADYVYICHNNTIYGTTYHTLPDTKEKILVADMSSDILSQPIDVTQYGLIFAGVQKNIGPAGTVIVIIREDLITDDVLNGTPTMLKYKIHSDNNSLYNTPPAYGIYICGKVFKHLKKLGGLEVMKVRNEEKAKILYDYLDSSKLFKGTVVKEDRSLMNVPFITGNKELDDKFIKKAKMKFHKGRLWGHDVVAVVCGIGKVNAAVCTQILVSEYNVSSVINVGVAGGIGKDIFPGDVVIAENLVQYDMDTTAFGDPIGQIPRLDTFDFKCDEKLVETAKAACAEASDFKTFSGRIVSGDMFVASLDKIHWLEKEFNALACEMEGASIAHVCYLNNIPCVVIRSISDNANNGAHMDFEKFTPIGVKNSTFILKTMLNKLQ